MTKIIKEVYSPQKAFITMTSNAVETTVAAVDTPVKIAGTYTVAANGNRWGTGTNGRLIWNGENGRRVAMELSISITVDGNNKIFRIGIAKNGTFEQASALGRKISTGIDLGAISTLDEIDLNTGDYIEPFLENITDDANATGVDVKFLVNG